MQLPSFHDYLVFAMTQLSENLNFVEIPTTSVGGSPDSDSMGEAESESALGLYPCGLGLDSTLVDSDSSTVDSDSGLMDSESDTTQVD